MLSCLECERSGNGRQALLADLLWFNLLINIIGGGLYSFIVFLLLCYESFYFISVMKLNRTLSKSCSSIKPV